jgi:3-carboxy-cis,cis-muconate cycloisomerase
MRLLDELFRSKAVEKAISDETCLVRMLEVEAALANALASSELIPTAAARQIESCCNLNSIDAAALSAGAKRSGNIAIPLVNQLTRSVAAKNVEAAKFVHWGATSQDIIDTALVLQAREVLHLILDDLEQSCSALRRLTESHRNTLMPGRTWMQHALPITFGMKTAYMLSALHRQSRRLQDVLTSISVLQFGGAAGTLAALGDKGPAVAEEMAQRLGLSVPSTPWHSHRDRLAELAAALGVLAGSFGKIARDIALLSQTEIAEVSESQEDGRGTSSTMPQKSNPVFCAAILANSFRVPGLVSTVLAAMAQEHERGLGGWHAEWETIPEILSLAGGAAERAAELLAGLEVHPERMRANLEITHGLIFAEAVSMTLGRKIGKSAAHQLVARAVKESRSQRRNLSDVLHEHEEVSRHISAKELQDLFDPHKYLGSTHTFIDRVLAECAEPVGASHGAH